MKQIIKKGFKVFLVMVMMVGLSSALYDNYIKAAGTQRNLADFLTDQSTITINDVDINKVTQVNYNDSLKMNLFWSFPNSISVNTGDTFVYDLSKSKINFEDGSGIVYDGSGSAVGTYTINDTQILIKYTKDLTGDVSGRLSLSGVIDKSGIGTSEGGQTTFEFESIGTFSIYVNRDTSNDQVTITKSSDQRVANDDTLRNFVLSVNAIGPQTNVVVSDTMGSDISLNAGSIAVYTDSACTIPYTGTLTMTNNAFPITIAQMTNGQTLYVKYQVVVSERAYLRGIAASEVAAYTNTAGVVSDTDKTMQTSSQKVTITQGWAKKTGVLASDNKSITWSFTLNFGDVLDLSGAKLQDYMTSNSEYSTPTSIQIQESNDRGVTWKDSELTVTWNQLVNRTFQFPEGSKKTYKFTYSMPINKSVVGVATYANKIRIFPYKNDESLFVTRESNTINIGTDSTYITKSVATASPSNQKTGIKWVSQVIAPSEGSLVNAYVQDSLVTEGQEFDFGTNYSNIKVYTDAELTQPYTGTYQVYNTFRNQTTGNNRQFRVELGTVPAGTKLYISYLTNITQTNFNVTSVTYKNNIVLGSDTLGGTRSATDSYNYITPYKQHLAKSNDGAKNGKVTWHLTVSSLSAEGLSDGENVTLVDNLPDNMSYVDGSLAADNGVAYTGMSTNYDKATNKLTITLTSDALAVVKTGSASLKLNYQTQIKDASLLTAANTTFTNGARLTIGSRNPEPIVNSLVSVKKPTILNKTVSYNDTTAPYADYTIKINQDAYDLDGSSDTLILKDTMGNGIDFVFNSLMVSTNGTTFVDFKTLKNQGYSYNYDQSTRTLSISVPDATALTITYKGLVNVDSGTVIDTNNANNFSNSVVLSVNTTNNINSNIALSGKVLEAKAMTVSADHMVQIYKYGNNDASNSLAGAVFSVDRIDVTKNGNIWSASGSTNVATITSGNDGYGNVMALGLKGDNVYRIKEITTPLGYYKADNYYLVFKGQDNIDYKGVTISEDNNNYALKVLDSDQKAYSYNVNDALITTDKTVVKHWTDDNNRDRLRPDYINVQLYADGIATGEPVALTSGGNWAYIFNDLPKINLTNGKDIVYTVREVNVPEGYSAAYDNDGLTITNSHQIMTVDKAVAKVWDDDNDRDRLRPNAISVQLYADGVIQGNPVALNAENNWSYVFTGLIKNNGETGEAIKYTIKEVTIPDGYTSTYSSDGLTVTNTHKADTVNKTATKVWDDDANRDQIRPSSIQIQLYADGTAQGNPVILNSDNEWKHTFNDLTKNNLETGEAIKYTIKEVTIPNGYTSTYSSDGLTVTNTHQISKIDKTVTKIWNDNNNQYKKRPQYIEVQLYANGKPSGESVRLNEINNWHYTWNNLILNESGKMIKYSVKEKDILNYTTTYSGDSFVITNTYIKSDNPKKDVQHNSDKTTGKSNKKYTKSETDTGDSSEVGLMLLLSSASLLVLIKKRKKMR